MSPPSPSIDSELPPGYRTNLVNALNNDDPESLLKGLAECDAVDRSRLREDTDGNVPSENRAGPWTIRQLNQSRIKRIDNDMYCRLTDDTNQTLHTLVFVVAANWGSVRIVSMLLSNKYRNKVDPSYCNNDALRCACESEHVEIVKLLLNDPRVNPTFNSNEALQHACINGRFEIVKLLLSDNRVDPSCDGNQAIRDTCFNGSAEVVKLLLNDARVCPSVGNNQPILYASTEGCVQVVKLLLDDPRVDPSTDNNRAIRDASLNGHVNVLKLLLGDVRVNPQERNTDGNDAIHFACSKERVDVLEVLLSDERIKPHINDLMFCRALQWASADIVRLFLAPGRISMSNKLIRVIDLHTDTSRVDTLFSASYPRIWPRVIFNGIECVSRRVGHVREKLDELEIKSSWMLLLCVKRLFTPRVAARVGDVLRDVCSDWTKYKTKEVTAFL